MSGDRLKDIPILRRDGGNLAEWGEAVREVLQTFRGYRGDNLDQALTRRMALQIGLIDSYGNALTTLPGPPGVAGPPGPPASYTPDLTPPPTPTGLVVTAGFSTIFVEHDTPTYTQGHGHDRTIVYGAKWAFDDLTAPTFGEAVVIDEFQGTIHAIATEPHTRWCIWIKWRSVDGVLSTSPAGGTNGAQATTSVDPSLMLAALSNQITETQLYRELSTRVNSIEALHSKVEQAAQTALKALLAANSANQDAQHGIAVAQNELTTKVIEDVSAEATQRLLLAAALGTTNAALVSEQTARATADTALSDSLTALTATVGTNTADIATEASARASADSALSSSITALTATVSTNTAAIATEASTRTSADSALSTSITTLTATVSGNTAAISTEASVRATETGALFGQYTTKIDLAGFITGYGLASTANNATPTSAFYVRADQFAVMPPVNFSQESTPTGTSVGQLWYKPSTNTTKTWDGSAWQAFTFAVPFVVQTTDQVVNGVNIPAGTYIDAAYIKNLTALVARLGNAWIDDAKIANLSASKLTAGSGVIGGDLKSSNYVANTSGWILQPGGNAEFGFAHIRGTLLSSQVSAGLITASMINVSQLSAIAADIGTVTAGVVRNAANTTRLDLGATGTQPVFKVGSAIEILANGSATFSGTLTASAVDAVDTINIKGNAIMVPVSAYTSSPTTIGTTETTTQSLPSFTAVGSQPVYIHAGFQVTMLDSVATEIYDTNGDLSIYLYRNTTLVAQMDFPGYFRAGYYAFPPIQDTPAAGTVTYHLKAKITSVTAGNSVQAAQRGMFGMHTKGK